MPVLPAARTKLISPLGWPRRANAAGEMKMGNEEGMPNIMLVVETLETLFILS
jgi:hypothetical protein